MGSQAEQMTVGGRELKVVKKLYRSRGSKAQKLTDTITHHTETKRAYYVTKNGTGDRLWVKEYVDPTFGLGTIQQEFDRCQQVQGHELVAERLRVRPVKPLAVDGNRFLMEYVDGEPWGLFERKVTRHEASEIVRVLKEWAKTCPLDAYDLSPNNILVIEWPDGYECVLIDFEISDGTVRI